MKKLITIAIVMLLVLSLVGCTKPVETPMDVMTTDNTITYNEENDTLLDTTVNDMQTAPTAEPTVDVAPAADEDVKVYVAKSYAEIYPGLYNFYEPTDYTYTRWVYSISSSSNFIGSIYLPDGRIIVGNGRASEDFSIDMTDDTYKAKPTTQGTTNLAVEEVNPSGEDFTISTLAGDVVASTRFTKNLKLDKNNSTEYKFELSSDTNGYILEECTSTSYLDKLFNESLYNVNGTVSADNDTLVRTNFATYVKYTLQTSDGLYEYAAVCIPYSMNDTVFILYKSDDYKADANLFGTVQSIFEGTNS